MRAVRHIITPLPYGPEREAVLFILPEARRGRQFGIWVALLVDATGLFVIVAGCGGASEEEPATPLKLGLLLDFSGSPEASADRKRLSTWRYATSMRAVAYSACRWKASPRTLPETPRLPWRRLRVSWKQRASTRWSVPTRARPHWWSQRACPGDSAYLRSAFGHVSATERCRG